MSVKTTIFFIVALLASVVAKAAKVDTITIKAAEMPQPIEVTIIVPDGACATHRVPTVYLLNGFGGDHKQWTTTCKQLPALADQYGMAMVMPDGCDSWYWDAPANPGVKMETFMTKRLVPYIDAHYPTLPEASKRAITGLSMGGHGALWLGIRHPDIWKNIGSTSGGVNILPFTERWKMKDALGAYTSATAKIWETHTVINLVPQMIPGANNIIFDCGSEDFFSGVNASLHQKLLEAKIPHDYISCPGNHSHKYWSNSILYHLLYFSRHFGK